MTHNLTAPVLFLIFNRPEQTAIVFDEIKKQQPGSIFIAADGPRENERGEEELCRQTRQLVLNGIDWECTVKTLFRDENLGCGKAVSGAIGWFFENVEEGIILEDDCLPDQSFFMFTTELLRYYRDDGDVMHISGNNFQLGRRRGDDSYYFSRYAHIWGWATWKRAWEKYDFSLRKYKDYSTEGLNNSMIKNFHSMLDMEFDTWDYQWFFAVWFNTGKAVVPQTNLVRNIGYGGNATHTRRPKWWMKKMKYGKIVTIVHPSSQAINTVADKYVADRILKEKLIKTIVKAIYKRIFKKNKNLS